MISYFRNYPFFPEWVTGGGGVAGGSTSPLIMTACILIILISIVLLVCFLFVLRKRNAHSTTHGSDLIKTQLAHPNGGSMLDEGYIVSYQLKNGGEKQPDILSRGELWSKSVNSPKFKNRGRNLFFSPPFNMLYFLC